MNISNKFVIIIFASLLVLNCNKTDHAQLNITEAFPKLNFDNPVDIQNAGDGTNRIFIVEQKGIIRVFDNDSNVSASNIFLDISSKVLSGGELGLLGLAFHPQYKSNGKFFINYTADNPRRTVIAKFTVNPTNSNIADVSSEEILLEVSQPYSNHNGGQIAFGPDGYLYISFGDGGSGGDPQNNAQNLNSLLGSIIRIDVNNKSGNLNYSIPIDNPFVNQPEKLGEIYAYGLRNTWRFSFEKVTGKLWAADVGQNKWEEIDIIEKGGNYGWRIMEGLHCYNPSSGCDTTGLIKPIWEYGHDSEGGYSITGGYVYNGQNASELLGKYIYADYVSGKIWSLTYLNGNVNNQLIKNTSYNISTFGLDENNELYFANYSTGKIYKFIGNAINSSGRINQPTFKLHQNFPNPFNPNTTINFVLDKDQKIKLEIFDFIGQKVQILLSSNLRRGSYSVRWNPSNLASNIYYYKLTTNSHSEVRKMVYLK